MELKTEDIKCMNIYEKLSLITDEIGIVEKNLEVQVSQSNSYKAVSERDVLDAVKPIEKKYRVYSYPAEREIIDKDTLVKESEYNGKTTRTNTLYMRVKTVYKFVNIDKPEEVIETIVYGDGLDTGDKAPGKAMTYADKYALMKAYKLSTGDDPDKDASPEQGYKKAETKKAEPPKDRPLTDAEAQRLYNVIKDAMPEEQIRQFLLDNYKVENTSQLTVVKYNEIVHKVKEMKEAK